MADAATLGWEVYGWSLWPKRARKPWSTVASLDPEEDPLAQLRRSRRVVPSFAEAAEAVHAEYKAAWRNPKHVQQWINTLRTYVVPALGSLRVDQIDSPDILRTLSPIWLTKPETVRRVRQRIGIVLDWAKAAGFRNGENPVTGVLKGLPNSPNENGTLPQFPMRRFPLF